MKIQFKKGIAPILVGKTSILILSTFVLGQVGILGVQIQQQRAVNTNPEVANEIQGRGQNLQPVIIPPSREEVFAKQEGVGEAEPEDDSQEVTANTSPESVESDGVTDGNQDESQSESSSEVEKEKVSAPSEVEVEENRETAPDTQAPSDQNAPTSPVEAPDSSQEISQEPVEPAPSVDEVPVVAPSPTTFTEIASKPLHVELWSFARDTANAIRSSNPSGAALLDGIAATPQARWFGEWVSNISAGVGAYVQEAKSANAVPMIVLYNIPYRDCYGYSGGGLADREAYLDWIRGAQQGIGNNPAVVILEPDAIALVDCLPQAKRNERYQMIADAVNILNQGSQTLVYIDAGHSNWVSASVMASRLQQSGVASARGFALNVSNFRTSAENIGYGENVSTILGGKGYVIDTSRNGRGPDPNAEWCNPTGRGLGEKPRFVQDSSSLDAYLWIKKPGESDGTCNGGPSAGSWWPEYAIGLAERAKESL